MLNIFLAAQFFIFCILIWQPVWLMDLSMSRFAPILSPVWWFRRPCRQFFGVFAGSCLSFRALHLIVRFSSFIFLIFPLMFCRPSSLSKKILTIWLFLMGLLDVIVLNSTFLAQISVCFFLASPSDVFLSFLPEFNLHGF